MILFELFSEDEDPEYKPMRMPFKDDLDDFTNSPLDDKDDPVEGETEGNSQQMTLWCENKIPEYIKYISIEICQ